MARNSSIQKQLDKEVSNLVGEAAAVYRSGGVTYRKLLSDKMLMIELIRNGVSFSLFELIKTQLPFSDDDWAGYLDVSTKSLQRYKASAKAFKPIQSEKIIELAEVAQKGLELFGDMDKFGLWLNTPNYALGNFKPFDLLRDSYGKEMVLGELIRANYGVFA